MTATNIVSDGVQPLARRRRAYAATCFSTMMSVIDGSIANTALPTIARDLHVGAAAIVWVINAFNLAVTATLFASAAYGASLGMTRIYRVGLLIFTAGSLACAVSGSYPLLVAARVLQGVGAAMIMSISPALVRSIFPRAELVRAFGWNSVLTSCASAAGPTAGGLLLAVLSWPWLFAINLPVALVAVLLGSGSLPNPPGHGGRIDIPSVVASAVGFGALVYGIDGISRHDPVVAIVVETALGAIVFAWFVRRQFRLPQPIIALDLFQLPIFAGAARTSLAAWVAWGIGFVTLPFVLQLDRGLSPLASGLLLSSLPLGTALSAPLAARVAERVPVRTVAATGLAVFAAGLALYAIFMHAAPTFALLAFGLIAGIGFGGFQAPNNSELLGTAPIEKSASSAAILATLRVGGMTLGASFVSMIFAFTERTEPVAFVQTAGPAALGLAAACAGVAALASTRREPRLAPA